jgi:hypothetical protein
MSIVSKISRNTILSLLLWAGVATLAVGFAMNQMWQNVPLERVRESAKFALIAFLLAFFASRVSRVRIAYMLALIWALALVYFVGFLPAIATALIALSGLAIGGCLIPACYGRSVVLPMVLGSAIVVGVIGWLLPFPIHFRWVYLLALVVPTALRWDDAFARIKASAWVWHRSVEEAPYASAFAAMAVGVASMGCWLPTVQFDDIAYHLGMPSQLAVLGYYRLDFFSQLWALAPWAGDIVQSMAQVLAGQEARGAVDALWLVASSALLWRLAASLKMPSHARWSVIALFASLPLTSALVGGMQAEMPATTILLALAVAVAEAPERPDARALFVISALAGFLLAVKTGFFAATIPAGLWLLWKWRGRVPLAATAPACILALSIAGSSYVYAYVLSGNPLLPLMNGIFHSPFIPPGNFSGTPYTAGGGLDLPWQLTFHTHLFIEGWDGAAGLSFLGLLGAFITAFCMPVLRPLTIVSAAIFLIPFETINYYRYSYPALVLMIPVTVAAAATVIASRRGMIVLLTLFTSMNFLFQGCSYYILHGSSMHRHEAFTAENIYKRIAPERLMAQYIRQRSATDTVLFCDPGRPFFVELAGRAFSVSWYDTELNKAWAIPEDSTGEPWRGLFTRTGVRYALTTQSKRSAALDVALADARKIHQVGESELWLLPNPQTESDFAKSRDMAVARFRP